ncbi:MAG: dipeptide ABC transporter ATP-binding protein [Myxococcota bacterium]|nr:dipeptide ABC transporter ATP-binding protein [Myxococcota bacterium]
MSATKSSPASNKDQEPILQVRNLQKYFPITRGILNRKVGDVKAVDNVSFDVYPNETLGLVGESGCGKTTTGRSLLRLIEPTGGEVLYKGENILEFDEAKMRTARRNLQIIFQDPYSSLNPRMTIENIIGEALEFHGLASGDERRERVASLLVRVGLQPSYLTRYPHEFSGGQRQRIGIARALALNPDFIVCDEAVSALDVSVQAQVINLLQDLQEEFNLSYLFIAHDLSVVQHISDRIAVMYLGQVAELSPKRELFDNPLHPYTQALLSAIPKPNPRRKTQRVILEGDVPSPINPPAGCRFHTRCPACYSPCSKHEPKTIEVEDGHFVRCHLYDPDHAPKEAAIWKSLPVPPSKYRDDKKEDGVARKAAEAAVKAAAATAATTAAAAEATESKEEE